jgi:hypothetical protein
VLESLYVSIIRDITFDRIRNILIKVAFEGVQLADTRTQINRIMKIGFDEEIAKIFLGLIHGDQQYKAAAERYVMLEATGTDIKKLDVPRRIKTKNEQIEFLSEIFKLLVTPVSDYSRIFLWIDEMEHIDNFSGKDLLDLRSFLRSMIDIIPSGLTIILNGTFKAAEDFNGFLNYLGPAIRDRIYKVIPLPPLEKEDTKIYVKTLLNDTLYRESSIITQLSSEDKQFFPFDENCIEHLYEKLKINLKRNTTPRNLNDALTSAMEFFMLDKERAQELIEGEEIIDSDYIDEKWEDIKIRFTQIL